MLVHIFIAMCIVYSLGSIGFFIRDNFTYKISPVTGVKVRHGYNWLMVIRDVIGFSTTVTVITFFLNYFGI